MLTYRTVSAHNSPKITRVSSSDKKKKTLESLTIFAIFSRCLDKKLSKNVELKMDEQYHDGVASVSLPSKVPCRTVSLHTRRSELKVLYAVGGSRGQQLKGTRAKRDIPVKSRLKTSLQTDESMNIITRWNCSPTPLLQYNAFEEIEIFINVSYPL